MEILFNPWVISLIVIAVMIGNIAALKYTANMKWGQMDKKSQLDRLNEIDQQRYPPAAAKRAVDSAASHPAQTADAKSKQADQSPKPQDKS
ncbi:DUF2897 family protein [Vibrio sp. HDW18]|nr:DUF2897 family protein [Vibrio sp. HDW18]